MTDSNEGGKPRKNSKGTVYNPSKPPPVKGRSFADRSARSAKAKEAYSRKMKEAGKTWHWR